MRSVFWLLFLVTLAAATPARAQQSITGSWREHIQRLREAPVARPAYRGARRTALAMAAVAESEPNNVVTVADSVAFGDQATGVIDPQNDVDVWFVDLSAGQFVSLDVDAKSIGSLLDPVLSLIAPDSTSILAVNDDFDGFDSRISYRVPVSGRYFVVIRALGGLGDPRSTYVINFNKVICEAVGTELEPNNTPDSASRLAVDASVTGELCAEDDRPEGDVDYWAFTAQAGTTIELDVDADLGLFGNTFLALFASDGTTRLAFNDDEDRLDSRLQHSIVTTGTYYAAVSSFAEPGGNPFSYTLHARTTAPGPGDPIIVRAEGLGLPLGLAVGNTGDVFIGDLAGNRIVRVSAQGVVTTFATGISSPLGVAFDIFGQLLVASLDGTVYRITPQGQISPFITDAELPFWIATAPDGRIWLTDLNDKSLRLYSPTGQLEAQFDGSALGGLGPGPIAIAPTGEPYVSSGTEIWKLEDGRFQRVLARTDIVWAIAFDVKGNIYAPALPAGRIILLDPAGGVLADPFAVGADAPQAVAFGRDADGATVTRLFATDTRVGRLIEVNPTGVEHPGQPLGGYLSQQISADIAAASLLGAGILDAADLVYLDGLGNRNGRYDVGDLQAYLRMLDGLPNTAQRRSGSDR
ncbi:MAG TPA: pre-peptidase C-terminal domain-containing protein [Longimicrobiales bacterium]